MVITIKVSTVVSKPQVHLLVFLIFSITHHAFSNAIVPLPVLIPANIVGVDFYVDSMYFYVDVQSVLNEF